MPTQPEVSLTGRAPTSPGDFYCVDSIYPSGLFTRAIVGTVAGYAACLQAIVAVGESGSLASHAVAVLAIVTGASGATIGTVCPLTIETHITDAPTMHTMMRFNTDASKDTPDFWFFASNPKAIAYAAGGGENGTKAGGIKIKITGSNLSDTLGYLRVYQTNT